MIFIKSIAVSLSAFAIYGFALLLNTTTPVTAGVDDACYLQCVTQEVNTEADMSYDNRCTTQGELQQWLDKMEDTKFTLSMVACDDPNNSEWLKKQRGCVSRVTLENARHRMTEQRQNFNDCKRYLQLHNSCSNQCVN